MLVLGILGHCFWVIGMLMAGYYELGIWVPLVGAVAVSYINRKWHLTNGCSEGRAIILGTIFAGTMTLALYLLGTWIVRMPGISD